MKKSNSKINFFFFLTASLIISCSFFNSDKQIVGRYFITNNKFGLLLTYRVDNDGDYLKLINLGVGKVGFDDKYIIVKIDQDGYVIIPIYKTFTYSPEKGIIGPMSLKEFKKKELNLKINAKFTINIE